MYVGCATGRAPRLGHCPLGNIERTSWWSIRKLRISFRPRRIRKWSTHWQQFTVHQHVCLPTRAFLGIRKQGSYADGRIQGSEMIIKQLGYWRTFTNHREHRRHQMRCYLDNSSIVIYDWPVERKKTCAWIKHCRLDSDNPHEIVVKSRQMVHRHNLRLCSWNALPVASL